MPDHNSPTVEPGQILPLFLDAVRDYALLMLDPVGNVTSWNQGAQLIKGYAAEETIGRSFSCFYLPEDVAARKPGSELERAALAGRFEDTGYRVRKDGSRFLANVVITAIRGPGGELLGYGKITRDTAKAPPIGAGDVWTWAAIDADTSWFRLGRSVIEAGKLPRHSFPIWPSASRREFN